MRYYSYSKIELDSQIYSVIEELQLSLEKEKLRPQKASPYISDPSDRVPVGEKFLSRKYKDLIGYLVLIHYLPVDEKHFYYLLLDFQEHCEKLSEFHWFSLFIEKELFLQWLIKQQTLSSNAFFGSIVNVDNLRHLMGQIVVRFEETFQRPKRTIRRRGYKDKGSLPNESLKARREEAQNDCWLTEEQLQIEEKRKHRHLEESLLKEFLNEGRTLDDTLLMKFRILKAKEITAV
jgi:hypothetical protein